MASFVTEPTLHVAGRATRHKFSDLTDLVVNGTFTGNATGWDFTLDAAQPAYAANAVAWSGAQAGACSITPTTPILTVGVTYAIKYSVTRSAGTLTVSAGTTAGTGRTAAGNYIEYLVCAGTTALKIEGDAAFTGTMDNVEVFTWVGSTNSAGGITVAGALVWQAANGGLFDPAAIMTASGGPLYEVTGATESDGGGGTSTILTDAGNFGIDIPIGTLANVIWVGGGGENADGVYEILAADLNSITIDLAYAATADVATVYVGGAYTNAQAAYDDDSTDVIDSAGKYHHRQICTNTDEYGAVTWTPAGGDRASGKYEKTVAFHTKLYIPAENAVDDRVISDMDAESYAGTYAANFATSYYMGSIEAARAVESKTRKRSAGDQVEWDADDNAIDVVTIGGDNVQLRNLYMHNTDQSAGADVITASAAKEGTYLINCRLDDADDLVNGGNLDQSVFRDCYFGANITQAQASYVGMALCIFDLCFFNGNGKGIAALYLENSLLDSCVFYSGSYGVWLGAGSVNAINCILYDQSISCVHTDTATSIVWLSNNIFSPAAAADYACYAGDDGTFIGSNNIAWSVTAGAVLTTPYFNNGESAAFWLPNTVEADPQFVDAANFDFRVLQGSPALNAGIRGLDPDVSHSSIGLDDSYRYAQVGAAGALLTMNWAF